jgi:hypothetical protein
MIDMAIPQFLWPLILETIVHITNCTATSKLKGKTPYEALTDELNPGQDNRPSVAHFRVLGCKTYVQIPKERRVASAKVAERAEVGILVGYEGTHIFKIYVPTRRGLLENRIVRSSNVRFDEGGLITKPFLDEDEIENDDEDTSITLPYRARGGANYDRDLIQQVSKTQHEEHHSEIETESEISEPELHELDQYSEIDDEDIEPMPTVTVRRTRKVYTLKPEFNRVTRNQTRERPQAMKLIQQLQNQNSSLAFIAAFTAGAHTSIYDDPNTIEEAKQRADWPEWQAAIQKEYRNLTLKGTWKLMQRTQLPSHAKLILGKLVFKTKRDKNGSITKRKARWVAKGFRQKHGTDFDQTYARVCKTTT